jgi:hypothetical protein
MSELFMEELVFKVVIIFFLLIWIGLLFYAVKNRIIGTKREKFLAGFFVIIIPLFGGIAYLVYKILTKRKI